LLPIWHWEKLKNNIELQKHIKEEYIITYNKAMLSALLDLKNSIYFIEEGYKSNSSYKKALENMKSIFYITLDKYKNGLIDFTEVATAEQNYLNAQNNLINSNTDIIQGIALFYKATGGGYNFDN
jgi:outer membrane protein TolC